MACLDLAQSAFAAAQYETAERAARQAFALFKRLTQEDPRNSDYPEHLGHSQWRLADALRGAGQRKQAEQVLCEAPLKAALRAMALPRHAACSGATPR